MHRESLWGGGGEVCYVRVESVKKVMDEDALSSTALGCFWNVKFEARTQLVSREMEVRLQTVTAV